jgi:hypothetical protein
MDEGLSFQVQSGTLGAQQETYSQSQPTAQASLRPGLTPYPISFYQSGVPRLQDAALPSSNAIGRTSPSLEVHHASPLAPLRARDAQVLDELFKIEQMAEIALDIHRYLARLYPEPCWEDEPYDFLRGFI